MTTNGSCRDFVMASEAKQSEILKKLEQIRKDIARKERKLQKLKRLSSHRSSVSSKPSDESHSSVADDTSPVLQEVATLSQREICEASGSGTETAVTISSATSGANGPVDYTRNSEPRLPRHHEDSSRSEATHISDGKPTSSTNTPDCEPNPVLPKTTLSPKPASSDASRASSRDVARPEQQSEIERIGRLLYSDSLTDSDRATRERLVDATDQALTDASKVRSPLKKKTRRSAGLDSTPCVSATGEYNLRKRKSLQSPAFVATKESRMILNAFSKLVQKASTFPVLPFESCQAELLSPMFQRKSSSGDEADASSQSPVAAAPKVDLGCRVRRRRRRSSMKVRSASPSTEDQEACSRQSNVDFRVFRRRSLKVEVVECEASQRNPVSRSLQQSQDATMSGIAVDRSVAENVCRKVGDGCSRSANSISTVTAVNAEPILLSSSNPSLVEVKKEVVTCAEGHGPTPAAQSDSDKTDSSLPIATDHFVPPLLHGSKCIVKTECVGKKATLTLPVITPALEDHVERCPRSADGVVENHANWIFADFRNLCKPKATRLEKQCVDAQPSVLGRRESVNASDPFVPSYSKLESDDQLKELVNSVVQCLDVEDGSQDGFGRTSVSGGGRCSEGDSGAEEERVLSAAEALASLTDEAREADDTEDDVNGAEELVSMRESDEENGCESFCSADRHTPCSPRGVIGDQNPLMFFCTLKCPLEEPVADVCFLDGTPRVLVAMQARAIYMWHFAGVWHPSLAVTSLQYEIEDQHCFLRYEGSSFLVYLNSGAPSQLVCVQWDLDTCQSSQLMLTCGSEYCTDPKGRLRIYLLTKLSDDCVATASRTSSGTSRIRVHRLRYVCGEVGDETEVVGRTSGTLHTLVGVDALPSALLGNQGNVFYVWDYKEKVLVKKMILEPNCFTDLHHICWASSDSGLLFLLMRTTDEEACHLLVANPFTCKSQLVNSYAWRRGSNPAIQSRHQQPQIQGHYMTCISPDLGIRIWNLLGGNPVAEMRSKKASSVAVADFSEHCVVAVGMTHGIVLVFTS
ncbi:uncharacterized protein ISCGN_021205 [Ixodes scapularis]